MFQEGLIRWIVVMSKRKAAPSSSVALPSSPDVLDRVIGIGPAPLLPGEAQTDYDSVATRVVAVARPRDAIEEFFTRDVIDLTWEILRLRRAKAGLWRAAVSRGVDLIHGRLVDSNLLASEFAQGWASGNLRKRQVFTELLKKADLTMDDVMAEALAEIIDSFERFDRMLASAEARRNNALREIDRHREALGDAIRRAVDVQDAEYRDIETGEMGGGSSP
jgi:hypothetical protein